MKKVNETVKKETLYIAAFTVIFSVIAEAVFLILGRWDLTVLLGNLFSAFVAVLNFFLMGITVQHAVEKDEKGAASLMKMSQSLRTVFLFAAAAVGVMLPCFNTVAVIVTLFFPRVAIMIRPLVDKFSQGGKKDE
ncbi:MAG: hypothetical protein IKT70_03605 [Clostridia bacterium]|nr:hypothetical protein [Clostridia bacterium]